MNVHKIHWLPDKCMCVEQVYDVRSEQPVPYMIVFSLCDICADAELLVDYGEDYFEQATHNKKLQVIATITDH